MLCLKLCDDLVFAAEAGNLWCSAVVCVYVCVRVRVVRACVRACSHVPALRNLRQFI